jgi:hypothetical protein
MCADGQCLETPHQPDLAQAAGLKEVNILQLHYQILT